MQGRVRFISASYARASELFSGMAAMFSSAQQRHHMHVRLPCCDLSQHPVLFRGSCVPRSFLSLLPLCGVQQPSVFRWRLPAYALAGPGGAAGVPAVQRVQRRGAADHNAGGAPLRRRGPGRTGAAGGGLCRCTATRLHVHTDTNTQARTHAHMRALTLDYTHIRTHARTHVHMRVHTCTHTHTLEDTHTHARTMHTLYKRACTYTHAHTHAHARLKTRTGKHMHVCTHTRTHTHTHTHTRTHSVWEQWIVCSSGQGHAWCSRQEHTLVHVWHGWRGRLGQCVCGKGMHPLVVGMWQQAHRL